MVRDVQEYMLTFLTPPHAEDCKTEAAQVNYSQKVGSTVRTCMLLLKFVKRALNHEESPHLSQFLHSEWVQRVTTTSLLLQKVSLEDTVPRRTAIPWDG